MDDTRLRVISFNPQTKLRYKNVGIAHDEGEVAQEGYDVPIKGWPYEKAKVCTIRVC